MPTRRLCFLPWLFLFLTVLPGAFAQTPPRVLIVTAHPDDEALFGGFVYKITHDLDARVDLAVMTDGSGGYHYAGLAEELYGKKLTDERVAREYLPAIRKKELMAGGRIIGIRKYFFFEQYDHKYTLNADSVLRYVWDADAVITRLTRLLNRERYDFVLTHLPVEGTHGHHKSASILALRAWERLPEANRPVMLGATITSNPDTARTSFTMLPGYPETAIRKDVSSFSFDRNQTFGYRNRMNYKIPVNWLIAEHKSQGTMQLLMNRGDVEHFWLYERNPPDAEARTRSLFERVANTPPSIH